MQKLQMAGSLFITDVIAKGSQQSKVRVERGELWLVVAVEDEATGEKGHLSVIQSYDKRDVDDEVHSTDNPALFKDNHPQCDWFCGLLNGPTITPDDATLAAEPGYAEVLEYKNGDGGWGLYPE
jgi:hypothetical protein